MSKDPPEDIKETFSESSAGAASEQPMDDSDGEIAHITASDDERKKARRDEAQDQEQQKKGKKKKAVKNMAYYGLLDRGDYLRLRGTGPLDRRTNRRQITPDQVKMMLLVAITEKGWTKDLAIYRNGVIDSQLTSMAQSLLATDPGLIRALEVRKCSAPQMQKQLKADPPPWCKTSLSQWGHSRRFRQQEFENLQGMHTSLKAAEKLAKNFKGQVEGSSTLRDEIRKEREKMGQTILDQRMFGLLKLRHLFSPAKQEPVAAAEPDQQSAGAQTDSAQAPRPPAV